VEYLISSKIKESSGKLYRVGGCVRDEFIGVTPKDIDYLVTGIDLHKIKEILSDFGIPIEIGTSFGIVSINIHGIAYDFSIPRGEKSTGNAHNEFNVFFEGVSLFDDMSRRDFTMCAIAKDVETGEYIDPFGGIEDIKKGRIKAVRDAKERFSEDPLRMLRAIQFANRFGFEIEPETLKAIKENVGLIDNITGERILEEFKKAFTKGKFHSNENFVDLLNETGLGKHIFGQNFTPMKVSRVEGDKFIVNMMLLFANGGDFAKLKPSVETSTAIQLGSKFLKEDALQVMFKFRAYFEYVAGMVKSIGESSLLAKLQSLNGVPLSAKELNIDSNWLMEKGITGKGLGDTQKALIQAIYEKKVSNSEPELREYLKL
jgi:tRNA nucleotidyltransferase/poly(A) polymerase